jgi:hypothetical protein
MPNPGSAQAAYNTLEVVKGWFDINAVTFSAKMSADVTVTMPKGRVVALNSSGEFQSGALGRDMPMWLMTNSDGQDVATADSGENYKLGLPEGYITAITAKHACELATTEYDTDQTYVPNEFLRGVRANSTAATAGRMTNQSVVYTTNTPANWTCVVGRVSKAAARRASDRRAVLRFWPADCLPGASGL